MPRHTLTKTLAGVLGVAAFTLLGAPLAIAAPETPQLVINEIETDGSPDWVELMNSGDTPLDISGVTLNGRQNVVTYTVPATTVLDPGGFYVVNDASFKLKKSDKLTLLAADGVTQLDAYEWGDQHLSSWGRLPNGTGDFVQLSSKTPGAANPNSTTTEPETQPWQNIKINEVTSANIEPYTDAYELYNSGDTDIDISAWLQSDNGHAPAALTLADQSAVPAGTVVPAGGFLVLRSNQGLSAGGDSVNLYLADGTTLVDSVTYGKQDAEPGSWSSCGDGTGRWLHTESDSWGESNASACSGRIIDSSEGSTVPCQTQPPSDLAEEIAGGISWPGSQKWYTSDNQCQFDSAVSGQDVSGLDIDPSAPDVMWAVKNKSHLYRLVKENDRWIKDPSGGWAEGKQIVFPNGGGQPDSEGITVGPDGYLYITTERDNTNKKVVLDSVLRYDPNEASTVLHPTNQWDLTADFDGVLSTAPGPDSNLGFEGITWVPDEFLTDGGFIDENTGEAYDPARYPGHGTGVFFLALEKNGHLYAYTLNNIDGGFQRIATIDTGMPLIAEAQWDFDNNRMWAVGDDSVGGSATLMKLDASGKFAIDRVYNRPSELANLNLEGFAITPDSTCVNGVKEVIRADDGNNGGHSLWSGTVNCDLGLDQVDPEVPGTPTIVLGAASVPAGGTLTISATGLAADTEYVFVMNSTPTTLGGASTDASGKLTFDAKIPQNAAAGKHTITVAAASAPDTVLASAPITVTSKAITEQKPKPLAATGGESVMGIGAIAALMLVAGACALAGTKRKRA
ncbi:lamin tail domain-containing protein [Leucobacter sp. UT-8R-CII-1-4]|uniref:lamin tail domain-containing protein n=1 Tax=Leucobacter sp. UT-8R-CII-1-4 TaxID=3040075 RepID=UPI0024A91646|nr:lamin tail domain-containing protein [Leucobacter sp. UT-8R-CII-1-4]MDI6023214.1 lamin tail domain-containing protein [Leucobacter sp. UT-8R-CII-1-4]